MTLRILKAQADRIAQMIKAFGRGEPIDPTFADRLAEAKGKSSIKIGVVMNRKFLSIDLPWTTIEATSEVALAAWLLRELRDIQETLQ